MNTLDTKIAAFKERVQQEWASDETAAMWQKYFPSMREQFEPITRLVTDAAELAPGMDVLDLASGTGEPSLSIAKRVAPGGTVTATDLNPAMLAALRSNADADGLSNVKTQQCDAHELPFADASFDRVTSRFGVMFFGETNRALTEVRRVLRPGGQVSFLVWGAPLPGSYFGTAALPFIKRLPEKPDPDGPGPMRYAEPGKLVRAVEAAGFAFTKESSHNPPAPYKGTPQQLLNELMEIAAPFRNIAASLPESDRKAAEREVIEGLGALDRDGVLQTTAPVIVVTAKKP